MSRPSVPARCLAAPKMDSANVRAPRLSWDKVRSPAITNDTRLLSRYELRAGSSSQAMFVPSHRRSPKPEYQNRPALQRDGSRCRATPSGEPRRTTVQEFPSLQSAGVHATIAWSTSRTCSSGGDSVSPPPQLPNALTTSMARPARAPMLLARAQFAAPVAPLALDIVGSPRGLANSRLRKRPAEKSGGSPIAREWPEAT